MKSSNISTVQLIINFKFKKQSIMREFILYYVKRIVDTVREIIIARKDCNKTN